MDLEIENVSHVIVSPGGPHEGKTNFYGFDERSTPYGKRILEAIISSSLLDDSKRITRATSFSKVNFGILKHPSVPDDHLNLMGFLIWKGLHSEDELEKETKMEFVLVSNTFFGKELNVSEIGRWVELSDRDCFSLGEVKLIPAKDWAWTGHVGDYFSKSSACARGLTVSK